MQRTKATRLELIGSKTAVAKSRTMPGPRKIVGEISHSQLADCGAIHATNFLINNRDQTRSEISDHTHPTLTGGEFNPPTTPFTALERGRPKCHHHHHHHQHHHLMNAHVHVARCAETLIKQARTL